MSLTVLHFLTMLLVGASGTAVVLTREPRDQTIGLSFFGLALALMFFVFQAPDVALSQLVVGAVALPLMILLTLSRIRMQAKRRERERSRGP